MSQPGPTLTRSTFWFAAAKSLGYALAVALPLVLVRLLTQAEFGFYKQAFLIATTAVRMLPFGFGLSVFYFFPRYQDRQGETALNVLLFNLAAGLLAFTALAAFPGILVLAFGGPGLVSYAPLIGLVILTWIFSSFLETVATALQDVTRSTLFIVGAQLTKALFMLSAALWNASLPALLWAALLQGVVQSAVLVAYVRARFPGFWRRLDWGVFKVQFTYIAPLSLANLIYVFRSDLPGYFVAHHFPAAEFAIYAVGVLQLPLVGILQESVGAVLLPRINELHHRGEFGELVRLLARATRKMSAIYWPCFAFFLMMAPQFIVAFYTRAYAASAPIFMVNLLIVPLAMLPLDPVFRTYTELRYYLLKLRLVLLAAMAAGLHFGIAWMGMLGAIGAVVLITFVERCFHLWKVGQTLRPRRQDLAPLLDMAKFAAAAALAAVPTLLVRYACAGYKPFWILVISAPVFGIAYAAAVLALRILSPEEKTMLWGALARRQRPASWW